eukprot:177928_1
MIKWCEEYETKYMIYDEKNAKVAVSTLDLLLSHFPKFLHNIFLKPLIYCTMNERLRKSIGVYKPSFIYYVIVNCLVKLQKLFVKYLLLPRSKDHRRTALKVDEKTLHFIPIYHIYESIYKYGYKIEDLGPKNVFGNGKLSKLGTMNSESLKDYGFN